MFMHTCKNGKNPWKYSTADCWANKWWMKKKSVQELINSNVLGMYNYNYALREDPGKTCHINQKTKNKKPHPIPWYWESCNITIVGLNPI